jgi:hypothetical protein
VHDRAIAVADRRHAVKLDALTVDASTHLVHELAKAALEEAGLALHMTVAECLGVDQKRAWRDAMATGAMRCTYVVPGTKDRRIRSLNSRLSRCWLRFMLPDGARPPTAAKLS